MFSKNLLRALLLFSSFSLPIMATGVAPEPVILDELELVDDPRANHLPQPMRRGALDFYSGFVRVAATLNHRDEATALAVVGDENSVIDSLAPEPVLTVGADPRAAVNRMNTPFLRFMDSTMLSNGWGRAPVVVYPGGATTDFEEEVADLKSTRHSSCSCFWCGLTRGRRHTRGWNTAYPSTYCSPDS